MMIYRPVVNRRCVKCFRIRSFSDPYFPAFGLNTVRYPGSLRMQSESRKKRVRKTPNTDNFHACFLNTACIMFIAPLLGQKIRLFMIILNRL